MGMSKNEEREYAKLLFITQGLTLKEIASRCKVTEKTVGRWKEYGKWKEQKQSLMVVKDEQIQSLYSKLETLNLDILTSKKNLVTSKDVDAIVKLTASIKQLETDTSIGETISVAKKIIAFIQPEDIEFAKQLTDYFDMYIKSQL